MSTSAIAYPASSSLWRRWGGDYRFLLQSLIAKDFKVRYRNMSLGVLWSLLNPLVMMTVLWFIFTRIFPNPNITNFPVFVLAGLVPYNFFAIGWLVGASSLVDNAGLIKRVPVPRELIPISGVLSVGTNLSIQVALLFGLVLVSGLGVNIYWLYLPLVWGFEIIFVCGLALGTAGLMVYVRDMRYIIESTNTVMFWLVPIFYPFSMIPQQYREVYQFNPVAALVLATRNILLEGAAPPTTLLVKLAFSSVFVFVVGYFMFRSMRSRIYDYL